MANNKKAYFENNLKYYLDNEHQQHKNQNNNSKEIKEFKDQEFEKILEKYTYLNAKNETEIKDSKRTHIKTANEHLKSPKQPKNLNAEEDNCNKNPFIDIDNINFENFDIYNFDFSKSIIKSNNEDLVENANTDKYRKKNIKADEKDFALYKDLEEYIYDNNLIGIIDPKNFLNKEQEEIKKIKSFENNFEEINEEKNKIIEDLKKIILNLQNDLEAQKNYSLTTVKLKIYFT